MITDEKILFDDAFLKEIQDKFYYVHEDYLGRKRQFFENSGGSLRLKAAVEEKARLEKIPDCPERIHDTSMMLKHARYHAGDLRRKVRRTGNGADVLSSDVPDREHHYAQ